MATTKGFPLNYSGVSDLTLNQMVVRIPYSGCIGMKIAFQYKDKALCNI